MSLRRYVGALSLAAGLGTAPEAFAQFGDRNFPDLEWKSFETEHFIIHYYPEESWTARKIAKYAEIMYPKITGYFNYPLKEKVHFVVRDQEDNSNGFAVYNEDWVTIWSLGLYYRLRGRQEWIPDVVTHEFAHIVSLKANDFQAEQGSLIIGNALYENGRRNLDVGTQILMGFGYAPFWWTEGGAEYWTHLTGFNWWTTSRDMLLRMSVLEETFLDYSEWQIRDNREIFGGEQGYNQGYSMGLYVMEQYGKEKYAELALNSAEAGHLKWDENIEDVLGVTGEQLHAEWIKWLRKKYDAQADAIRKEGEVPVHDDITFGNFTKPKETLGEIGKKPRKERRRQLGTNIWINYPRFSPDGQKISIGGLPAISVYDVSSDKYPPFNENKYFDDEAWGEIAEEGRTIVGVPFAAESYGWSPDSKKIVVASQSCLDAWKGCYDLTGYEHNDLYIYDLESEKGTRISKHLRAVNPDWAPDGKDIVFVRNVDGQQWLGLIKPDGTDIRWLIRRSDGSQVDTPRFSPDGTKIVFPFYKNGQQDIWIINRDGSDFHPITWDKAEDKDPIFSQDGKSIFFSSDRSGIFNIYKLSLETGEMTQITNVIAGAFAPFETKEGNLLMTYFTSYGFKWLPLAKEKFFNKKVDNDYIITEDVVAEYLATEEELPEISEKSVPYKAYKAIRPPLGLPILTVEDNFVQAGMIWIFDDYLSKHNLSAQAIIGGNQLFFARYENHMWYPSLYLGAYHFGLNRSINSSIDADGVAGDAQNPFSAKVKLAVDSVFAGASMQISSFNIDASYNLRAVSQKQNSNGIRGETFLGGQNFDLRLRYGGVGGGGEGDVNPRGRAMTLNYTFGISGDPSALSTLGNFDTVEAVPNNYNYHSVEFTYAESIATPWYRSSRHTLDFGFNGGWINRNVQGNDEFFAGSQNPLSNVPDISTNVTFSGYAPFSLGGETKMIFYSKYRFPLARRIDKTYGPLYIHGFFGEVSATAGNIWGFTCDYLRNEDGSIAFAGDGKSGINPSLEDGIFLNTPVCVKGSVRREIPFVDIAQANGNAFLYDMAFTATMKANLFDLGWNSYARVAYPFNDVRGQGDVNADRVSADAFPANPLVDEEALKRPRFSVGIGASF
jgi:hypothetical protein